MPGTLNPKKQNESSVSKNSAQAADNVLKHKAKTMEESDEARKLARAAERELQQRLSKELESAKLNALLVQESWRKIMRTIKVSYGAQTVTVMLALFLTLSLSYSPFLFLNDPFTIPFY